MQSMRSDRFLKKFAGNRRNLNQLQQQKDDRSNLDHNSDQTEITDVNEIEEEIEKTKEENKAQSEKIPQGIFEH